MNHPIIQQTAHREYPLPNGPWLMTQTWQHLLFLHWPVPIQLLRDYIPSSLEIDTYEQTAWISIIPFQIRNMRLRMTPSIPYVRSYLELNVRTYVRCGGIKGVYFFSLDADKWHAVLGARMATLPYFYAKMGFQHNENRYIFTSERYGMETIAFDGSYYVTSNTYYPEPGSLDYWLSERYFLWTHKFGHLYRIGIHHEPWKLQQGNATIHRQSMTPFLPDTVFTSPPKVTYALSKRALFWYPKMID